MAGWIAEMLFFVCNAMSWVKYSLVRIILALKPSLINGTLAKKIVVIHSVNPCMQLVHANQVTVY